MPKIQIKKSIEINAPSKKVYEAISNFNHWPIWSPWLIQEPEALVEVADDGKSYSWEGKRVGSGNMRITKESNIESLHSDLTFLKPWKSQSKVKFELTPIDDGTKVSWHMDSSLPFFMFWMKKMMTAYVGSDYERGLNMLKDYVEVGEVHSKLEFKGTSNFPGCNYIGIKTHCTMNDLGKKMSDDLGVLWEFMGNNMDQVAGESFSIYHKWDMVNRKVIYTSGIPVKENLNGLPAGMIAGNIPPTPIYTIKHTGPYRHLGNAWSTLYNMQRNKVFKVNKLIHPFETYINSPGEVHDNELITEIHFPVKS